MEIHSLEYRASAARILRETPAVRASVTGATVHFDQSRQRGWADIDAQAWRRWAEGVKSHVLTHLDRYLDEAVQRLEANGVRVHWAPDAAAALAILRDIATRGTVRRVVKGKSMLSEELGVNEMLAESGIEVFETDLGEYILQLLAEPPSHILGPAIHRSLEDIRALFHQRFETPMDASPDTLAAAARRVLRAAFLTADLGITGANFVVAETGTIAIIENEGNIRLSTSLPRLHVALVGIEKLLPRWSDLAPFLQLTSRTATGQTVGTFVSLVQGPRTRTDAGGHIEPDGPDEVHVILVDNGRTRVLADEKMWETLRCVRCGACLNICPVYRQTGGHAYGWVYSGPIGAVLNPGLRGLAAMHTLPFASTLCGACADVCPVRIPIPQLLLEWRTRAVAAGLRPRAETRIMHAFARTAVKPALFQAAGRALAMLPASLRRALPLLRDWAGQRAPLVPAFRSFLDRWKEPGHSGRPASVDTRAANNANPTDAEAAPPAAAARSPEPDANVAARLQEDTRASVDAHSAGERRVFAGGTRGPATARTPDTPHGREAGAVMRAVREALAGRTRVAHPGALIAADDIAGPASVDASVVDRFMVRFRANGGEVVRFTTLNEALEWLQQVTQDVKGVAVSALVPEALSAFRFGVQPAPPETAALGMSMATGAAAASGTLLLDSRERRAIHLLPPQHIVWLREGLISPTLDQLLEAKRADLPAALGLHSGPSKSADIGRVIVTGVHGPGRVIAAIVP